MNICVYGASSNKIDEKYIKAGEELGEALAAAGHALVFGGGASGLMGAAARGAKRGGGKIVGVAPSFFNVDGILYPDCDEFIYTETMRERKEKMEQLAGGFVMSPGGIGTFEEFFEILTLRQLGRHQKPIAVLNTGGYFEPLLLALKRAISEDFMTAGNMKLFAVCDTPKEVIKYLAEYKAESASLAELKSIGNP